MLKQHQQNGVLRLFADAYTLTFAKDRPYVYLSLSSGERVAELFMLTSVHPLHGRDDTTALGSWQVEERLGEIVFTLLAESSIWKGKVYRLRCTPERFVYEVEVEGAGLLDEVDYLGGYYSGQLRWGSGFFWSGQHFRRGFTPEPNTDELCYFAPSEGSSIGLNGVPLPGKADWFFTPPPFCFGFESRGRWLGVGVQARPGEKQFTEYSYHGQVKGFYLSLSYEGHNEIAGRYQLPALGFDFGQQEFDVIKTHVDGLRATGYVPPVSNTPRPDWWYEPIFCGWGAQCYQAEADNRRLNVEHHQGPAYSRQANYDRYLAALESHGISPGTVVLDDKWQATYGDNQADEQKWPDLAGFIRGQHEKGRRVLLWLKAWDLEGVPVAECITNSRHVPLSVDPTHPDFENRLRASIRRMLSPDGYDADGFKIDFTARIPTGPGICTYRPLWGLELMRRYLEIIYEEAKRTKPDALVMSHTPHPYLADVTDMIRLNDINKDKDINRAMRLRARIAEIACPGAIIDTDNWPMKSKASWRRYLKIQPDLGVPSLYYVTHIDATQEPLTERDYRLIRQVWEKWRALRSEINGLSKGNSRRINRPPRRFRRFRDNLKRHQQAFLFERI